MRHPPTVRRLIDNRIAIVQGNKQIVFPVVHMHFRGSGPIHRIRPDAIGNPKDYVRSVPVKQIMTGIGHYAIAFLASVDGMRAGVQIVCVAVGLDQYPWIVDRNIDKL